MTLDELAVTIESLREYRLRADLPRRVIIDPLILKLISQLALEGGCPASDRGEAGG